MQDAASGLPLATIVVIGALALLPIAFMTATSFAKISVVFSILRNALGVGQVPSGAVVTALAAILTLYVMAPVGAQMLEASAPAAARIDPRDPLADLGAVLDAARDAIEPLRAFLERNAERREIALFLDLARRARPADQRDRVTERDLSIVLPAFVIAELSEAFQIGFLIFVPFLVLDLVISSLLMSLGMQSLQPAAVSLPFKLLLFVIVDGWYLLARALVLGYA